MDDAAALVERARQEIAAAASRLAAARHARWEGVHADSYRALLEDHAAMVTALAAEVTEPARDAVGEAAFGLLP